MITRALDGERVEVTWKGDASVYVVPYGDFIALRDHQFELERTEALEALNKRRKRHVWKELRESFYLDDEMGHVAVELTGQANDDWPKVDSSAKDRIAKEIDSLTRQPEPKSASPLGYNLYRVEIEEQNRIVYQLSPDSSKVTIANLGHYCNVYRGYKPRFGI